MRRLALLTLFSFIVPASAGAAIIPFLQSGPTLITSGPFAGDFEFNYVANLSGDERLDPVATNTSGDLPPGTFFTLYDIGGLASFGATAASWTPSFQPLGLTPSSIPTSFDSAGLPNVTFAYTGPVVHANGTTLMISGFQIISTLDSINPETSAANRRWTFPAGVASRTRSVVRLRFLECPSPSPPPSLFSA